MLIIAQDLGCWRRQRGERPSQTARTVDAMSDSTRGAEITEAVVEIDESALDDVNGGASVDFSTEALRRLNGR